MAGTSLLAFAIVATTFCTGENKKKSITFTQAICYR